MAIPSEQSSGAQRWSNPEGTARKIANKTSSIIWDGVFAPVLSSLKHRYRKFKTQKQIPNQEEELKGPLPKPYRPRRRTCGPRALTMPLEHGTQQESLDQMQSRFFNRLPVELRLMIYKEAVGGPTCHIMSNSSKLYHNVCGNLSQAACWFLEHNFRSLEPRMDYAHHSPGQDAQDLLPLLLTCRRMHVFHSLSHTWIVSNTSTATPNLSTVSINPTPSV